MFTKRRLFRGLLYTLIFIAFSYSIGASIYLFLPGFLENRLIPHLAGELGITPLGYEIRKAGITGFDLSSVRLGNPGNPDLSIESLRVYYSPADLLRKRVGKISISGLTLNLEYRNGNIYLPEFDLGPLMERMDSNRKGTGMKPFACPFEKIEIRNFLLLLKQNETSYRVPAAIDILPVKEGLDCQIRLYPRGRTITSAVSFNVEKSLATFDVSTGHIPLPLFSDLARIPHGLFMGGTARVMAKAALSLAPFSVISAGGEIHVSHGNLRYHNAELSVSDQDGKAAFEFGLNPGENRWNISSPSISILKPFPMVLSRINLFFGRADGMSDLSGNLMVSPLNQEKDPASALPEVAPVDAEFFWYAREKKDGNWMINLSNNGSSPELHLKFGENAVSSRVPDFNISATAGKSQINSRFLFRFPKISISTPSAGFAMDRTELTGEISLNRSGTIREALFDLNTIGLKGSTSAGTLSFPRLFHRGRISADSSLQYRGKTLVTGAFIALPEKKITVKDMDLNLPFSWPPPAGAEKGTLKVASILWNARDMGALGGVVVQKNMGARFDLSFQGRMIRGMRLDLNGSAGLDAEDTPSLKLNFHLSPFRLTDDLDLTRFHPAFKGVSTDGTVKLDGHISIEKNLTRSSLDAALENGRFRMDEKKIEIQGVDLALSIPDLLNFHTKPGQVLTFEKLSAGEIRMYDGKVRFTIESPETVLWEYSNIKWCGGNISTQSFRTHMKKDRYDLILYCDRLDVSEILNQLGAFSAEGEGAVNGRIPVKIQGGNISFKDGFLYSTPGDGGIVRITGTELLTAGIPVNTPQFAQLELAREALKDYRYNWVKLIFNTSGEELHLTMKMDGKPERPLPFVYKKELGSFVKVDASSPGSNFQGINIDVNFMIPLNSIVKYGTSMRDLIKMNQ